jgi:UDP-GlcNAc:undecaprenyl-phosphate GlcNAc-1-phosphate transferase
MSYLMLAVGAAAVAAATSYLLTPIVRQLALRYGAAHQPRARDLHIRPVARWGGLAIYAAFLLGLLVSLAWVTRGPGGEIPARTVKAGVGLLLGGTVLSIIGAVDDRYELSPRRQFAAQILCAAMVIPFGVLIDVVSNPFRPGGMVSLGVWAYPVTLLWIVGVTNAINWIDGLDGLAAGICAIAATALVLLAAQSRELAVVLILASLGGSLVGFLRHNFAQARIYMGGGAPFVGFCLATTSAFAAFKAATAVALLVPVLILGVPILDTVIVITRRLAAGRPIYQADKSHIHHRLLARGFTPRQTVLILYAVSLGLTAVAVFLGIRF